jgi:hypothetical protein
MSFVSSETERFRREVAWIVCRHRMRCETSAIPLLFAAPLHFGRKENKSAADIQRVQHLDIGRYLATDRD